MHIKGVLAFAALSSAIPLLKERDSDVETVTTWEIDFVTSYTTLWVGMPPITASSAASVTTTTTSTTPIAPTTTTKAQPVKAIQNTQPVLNPPTVVKPSPVEAANPPVVATTTDSTPLSTASPQAAVQSPASSTTNNSDNFAIGTLTGATAEDGPCSLDKPCSGDITHYNPSQGVGACGPKNWSTGAIWEDTDIVVAVSHTIMGTESNGGSAASVNPLCNRSVHIKAQAGGKDVVAKVVDKCAGCTQDFALDLSPAAFQIVAPNGNGRVHDVEWYWV